MKKVSIITINRNNSVGLNYTLESIKSQTFIDYELLVIDGNSNDGSLQVIDAYQSIISNFISEKDNGIYDAQNKGIRLASGDYCLFLNSGDKFASSDVLELVFSNPQTADILYGNMYINYGNNRIILGKMPKKITLTHMIGDTLWHPVSFIKRTLFDKYGQYNELFRFVADYDFFLRVLMIEKVKPKHIGVTISIFDTTGISSQYKNRKKLKDERRLVQEQYFHSDLIDKETKRYKRFLKLKRFLLKLDLI